MLSDSLSPRHGAFSVIMNEMASTYLQWTQNYYELGKRHSKRGKEMKRTRGKRDGEESV
jgi:hypothetical protein